MSEFREISPMLADGGEIGDRWVSPKYWAEEKIDGSRYIMQVGKSGEVRFTSRRVSSVNHRHVDKTGNVPHLVKAIMAHPELSGTVLDGEILHGKNSSSTTSIMGSKPDKAIEKQEKTGWVVYHVFDVLAYKGIDVRDCPLKDRRVLLENIVGILDSPFINAVPVYRECREEAYRAIVEAGGEGVILKDVDSTYREGERSRDWLKVKRYDTDDVVIMGATPPSHYHDGNLETWQYWETNSGERYKGYQRDVRDKPITVQWYRGWIGSLRFGKYDKEGNLKELGQTSGLTYEERIRFTDPGVRFKLKDEYVGTCIEIGFMEKIKKTGAYRHPRFIRVRTDKDPKDCVE